MARVLIAGYGYLGDRLATRLVEAEHRVYGLRRRPRKRPTYAVDLGLGAEIDTEVDADIAFIRADLTKPETLESIPTGLDYVMYMASAGQRDDEAYRQAYVKGLENLLGILRRRDEPIRRLLFVSSTGVYERTDGGWVDERTPVNPQSFSGRRLIEGETIALGAGYPTTVLRLSGIYGPGRALFVNAIQTGESAFSVDEKRFINLIHVDDAAGALAHLMTHQGDQPAELYLGADHEPVKKTELLRWLCRELGAKEPVFERPAGSPRTNKRCRNAQLLASGYRFRFPTFREGYRQVLSS